MTTYTSARINKNKKVKRMPYSQYLCNLTQFYIGACVFYIITLTNEVQPLLPGWYRWLICSNHVCGFRHLLCVTDGMVSGMCVVGVRRRPIWRGSQSFYQSQGLFLQTVRAPAMSTWGRCNRGQTQHISAFQIFLDFHVEFWKGLRHKEVIVRISHN